VYRPHGRALGWGPPAGRPGNVCRVTPRNDSDDDEGIVLPVQNSKSSTNTNIPSTLSTSQDWGDSPGKAENWDYDNKRDWKGISLLVGLGLMCVWGARLAFQGIMGFLPATRSFPNPPSNSTTTAVTSDPPAVPAEPEGERRVALEPEELFGRDDDWQAEEGKVSRSASTATGVSGLKQDGVASHPAAPSAEYLEGSSWLDNGMDAEVWDAEDASTYDALGEEDGEQAVQEQGKGEKGEADFVTSGTYEVEKDTADSTTTAAEQPATVPAQAATKLGVEKSREGVEDVEGESGGGGEQVKVEGGAISWAAEKEGDERQRGEDSGKGETEVRGRSTVGEAEMDEPPQQRDGDEGVSSASAMLELPPYQYNPLPIEQLPSVELPSTAVDDEMIDALPKEKSLQAFSQRSALALSAATAASEASNRAAAYAAAASAAASKAAESATAAAQAARIAHQGMENATEEAMAAAEERVEAAARAAQEAESRAAAAAGMASAYEDVASSQKDLAQRSARLEPEPEPEPTRAESWIRAQLAWWEMSPVWQKIVSVTEPLRDFVAMLWAKFWAMLVAIGHWLVTPWR